MVMRRMAVGLGFRIGSNRLELYDIASGNNNCRAVIQFDVERVVVVDADDGPGFV